ncbi:MFS transporter [Metabacillus sp. GX 13764]|uniref:MDR family MFS transporter n=1 Tax=Metabacillus kandeliae TaxID=2900151 RepID=UPI001E367849|nr:MFS transporter [Metabacillus kandeliae]MCD7035056.1 MFS transporter [Metabacillus kandeliae]
MKKLQQLGKQFHPIVWVLLFGTIMTRAASAMTLPFLAIYLSREINLSPLLIGLTVGISPLMSAAGGFIGGHLSDRFGRKPVMLTSLFILSFVYACFSIAGSPVWFVVLNALNGLCNSFFEPVSQALIADLTEKKNRMKAYSYRYTAINIGAAVGPLMGAYMASTSPKMAFLATASVYFIYCVLLFVLMKRFLFEGKKEGKEPVTFKAAAGIIRRDTALRYLILGSILVNIGYAQMESNLPQHLSQSIENSVAVYSILLTINALMVVILQIPISHAAGKFKPMQVMIFGAIMTAGGLICFGYAAGWFLAAAAMILFTLGEILIFPSSSLIIDDLAQEHLRGTYFGAAQFRRAGSFMGPIFGGYLLGKAGGMVMFEVIGAITLCSILFFLIGSRVQVKLPAVSVKKEML